MDPSKWNNDQVLNWLDQKGLSLYVDDFQSKCPPMLYRIQQPCNKVRGTITLKVFIFQFFSAIRQALIQQIYAKNMRI